MSTVVFLLPRQLHLLDLAGPAQVFSTANDLGHPYRLYYVGEQTSVPTAQGVSISAETTWPELTAEDLIIVPGWRVSAVGSADHLGRVSTRHLVEHHAAGGTVASVCAGAFLLGQAGLLDGRRCTTHHQLVGALARQHPRATVVNDVLYVADGQVVTSAGIASGIDLALHLVATWHGPVVAAQAARLMVVYARRNGEEPQGSAMLRYRSHLSDGVHRVQDLIEARCSEPLPLAELAAAAGMSVRTLTRRFAEATGMTPLRYQQILRIERAEHLMGHGATVEAAARTVGFADARMLRRLRSRGE